MLTRVYTIKDVVAEEFGPLYQARNDGVAIRGYRDLMARPMGTALPDPREYRLYCVAEFDNSTGYVHASDPVEIAIPPEVPNEKR